MLRKRQGRVCRVPHRAPQLGALVMGLLASCPRDFPGQQAWQLAGRPTNKWFASFQKRHAGRLSSAVGPGSGSGSGSSSSSSSDSSSGMEEGMKAEARRQGRQVEKQQRRQERRQMGSSK
jgi:hypothetical protein